MTLTANLPAGPVQPDPSEPAAVVLLSGGLDSTTLLYDVLTKGGPVTALSFDYGQRHHKELDVAQAIVADLASDNPITHHVISIGHWNEQRANGPLADLLSGSALTDKSVDVPEGHYAAETMKATVVPNRNAIMLSLAYGVAVAQNADAVYMAVHAGDHAIYPDCRPEFIDELESALHLGNRWSRLEYAPDIEAPFIYLTKRDIAQRAFELDVPVGKTWSCYKGGEIHCGRCGTCVERREAIEGAIELLGLDEPDPTTYEDRNYWKTVKAPL